MRLGPPSSSGHRPGPGEVAQHVASQEEGKAPPPRMARPDGTVSHARPESRLQGDARRSLGLPLPGWVLLPWGAARVSWDALGVRGMQSASGQDFGGSPDAGLVCCLSSSLATDPSIQPWHSHCRLEIGKGLTQRYPLGGPGGPLRSLGPCPSGCLRPPHTPSSALFQYYQYHSDTLEQSPQCLRRKILFYR